jgi:hypothetical protein
MARSINDIRNDLLAKVAADTTLGPLLTSTSNTAVFKLWCYIFAVAAWALENLQDLFKQEVDYTIAQDKTHTPQWYVKKAKQFQYGFSLVAGTAEYDNTGIADSVVAASKIVAFAAIVEEPKIRMKVAKLSGSNLTSLTAPELTAFVAYVKQFRDAGVRLHGGTLTSPPTITSTTADKLKLSVRVVINPLVLDAAGARRDGSSPTPVKDAVRSYLQNIDFNGLFDIQKLQDAIQKVDGVVSLKIDSVQSKYGLLPFTTVDINFVPDSGYLVMDDVDFSPTYILS